MVLEYGLCFNLVDITDLSFLQYNDVLFDPILKLVRPGNNPIVFLFCSCTFRRHVLPHLIGLILTDGQTATHFL